MESDYALTKIQELWALRKNFAAPKVISIDTLLLVFRTTEKEIVPVISKLHDAGKLVYCPTTGVSAGKGNRRNTLLGTVSLPES